MRCYRRLRYLPRCLQGVVHPVGVRTDYQHLAWMACMVAYDVPCTGDNCVLPNLEVRVVEVRVIMRELCESCRSTRTIQFTNTVLPFQQLRLADAYSYY